MADRLAENGAIITGQESTATVGTVSRLGGAGQIEADIRKVLSDGIFTTPVSGLTVRGRIINKALDLTTQVRNIFNKYGTDAHLYLPGIGVINGFTAGNYLDSAGVTPATMDNPVGLVLDANGTIDSIQATTANKPILRKGAVNLLLRSQEFDVAAVWNAASGITANTTIAPDGTLTADTVDSAAAIPFQILSCLASTQYTYSVYIKLGTLAAAGFKFAVRNDTGGAFIAQDIVPTQTPTSDGWTRITYTFTTPVGCVTVRPYLYRNNVAQTGTFFAWGAQLELGATATTYVKTTTAAASNLVGGYHWVADATDLLTATYPAGYESATIVNALAAGQSTLTAQNIVGAYSIGPSVDTYGRFVFRTGLTASELAIIQQYANRLAGV